MRRSVKELNGDRSGAVALMSVFMSVILAGMLWYTFGVGQTIIHRETLLDAADATAYAAAVYDARGLNVICMLNLIMAAVMAILVALKILQALTVIVDVVSCLICAVPFGEAACPICDAADDATVDEQNAITKVQKVVDDVEPTLNKAATLVAIGMPWIGEIRSVIMAATYGQGVSAGFSISLSQLPTGNGDEEEADNEFEGGENGGDDPSGDDPPAQDEEEGEVDTRGGGGSTPKPRLGLPVENGSTTTLCKAAAVEIVDAVRSVTNSIPVVGTVVGYMGFLLDSLVGWFPDYFCGLEPNQTVQTIKNGINNKLNGQDPTTACTPSGIQSHNDACNTNPSPSCKPYTGGTAVQQCKTAVTTQKNANTPGQNVDTTENMEPKAVYYRAIQGNSYYSVYSVVWGDLNTPTADQWVGGMSWGGQSSVDTSQKFFARLSFAKADFFFDAADGGFYGLGTAKGIIQDLGGSPLDTHQYQSDYMWNMRWRARLRRARDPILSIGPELAGALNIEVNSFLGKEFNGVLQWVPGENVIESTVMSEVLKVASKLTIQAGGPLNNYPVIH